MLTVLVIMFLLIALDISAMRWGFISSDGPNSKEWERRRQYAELQECRRTPVGERVQACE